MLEGSAEKVTHNRLTQLNGIRWRYDIHGRTVEKDNGQTRWHYCYDGEHRLTEVISQPRDRNKPQTQVSFRYDPLGRRISKTRRQMLGGQSTGKPVTTRFVWEGVRLLQEVHGDVPLTCVYSDQDSYDPLARIDGVEAPEIFWFHCQPNGTPERMTDSEGQVRWEGVNSAWGKLLRESETQVSGYSQNLRTQGQYLDRETGLHYNLFRYYDPDCGRFTQQDPIGLAGGINLYQYGANSLTRIDPLGLKQEEVIRYMSKDEAIASASERDGKGGLVPNNRGEKAIWVNHDSRPGFNPGNEKYRAVMTVNDSGVELLNQHSDISKVDYKETGLKDGVLSKRNKLGAGGIGKNILPRFNDKITSFQIEKKDAKGNWKKCGKRIT
ncbi:UNVERIFIED_CONTAM: RHS repeat-associated protein [Enterobacter sp. WPR_3_1]